VRLPKVPAYKVDLAEMWFWILAAIPTCLWLRDSILWVLMISLYANAKTAHGASKAERGRKEVREMHDDL
jgi:hypothetical protein